MKTIIPYAMILIVDSILENINLLTSILTKKGYIIYTAKTGHDATASIKTELPDLILININLPDITGYEVCVALKADSATSDLPVIFISSVNDIVDKLRVFTVGGTDFISNPFIAEEIIVRVQYHLEARDLRKTRERQASELHLKNEQLLIEAAERRRVEEIIHFSEIRYRRLFETSKDGILILDAETGMIDDVNPFMIDMLGFTYEQFQGKTIWDIGFFKDIIPNKDKFLELQGEEYVRYEDLPLETVDGRKIDVEFVSNVYKVDRKKVIQCNIRNITERKKAKDERSKMMEELERSNVDLQQFAYVASHDLQEPLRMISSYLQLIERRYKDKLDSDANDFIHFAVDGANRQQALLIGLLEYFRIMTQNRSFIKMDMNKVIKRVLSDLELQITESGAIVEYDDLPDIFEDEIQISRLFQNLIQNAIKFRREDVNPVIKISSEMNGKEYTFCVSDNGIGIDEQYFNRIFIIFQKHHVREEYEGTGIGLSICKRIVERHGGKIWIKSRFGEGSSFYFIIPGSFK